MRDQAFREVQRPALSISDDGCPTHPACSFFRLQRFHLGGAKTHRGGRNLSVLVLPHSTDQRLDESRRRQQGVALEIDYQVRLMDRCERFGTSFGSVAAL